MKVGTYRGGDPGAFQGTCIHTSIQNAISRDRFKIISSKLYFASPTKPLGCAKTYIDDVIQCLKGTFQKCRHNSNFQSIDESMTKFKGRLSLERYMLSNPVKREIKLWLISDSFTGYTHDLNIYMGRETERLDATLGERVVNELISTAKEKDITFSFDRFFTSTALLQNIDYAPCSKDGPLFVKWQDTKEVLMLSNCHNVNVVYVNKTLKNGSKSSIPCPEMIPSYGEIMGGVDFADQMMELYELDRKSNKLWKKVSYCLFMVAVVNAKIIYKEKTKKKISFQQFLLPSGERNDSRREKNSICAAFIEERKTI
ncbi:hypothetical protein ILUMI_21443 [Ignelater luminosus]|uniref:PiggyBac transposable element-derived protein domain-containing protein n=1 Tax=Ignelater luminosus TaxID=2038154 RepID=A0A8K0CG94_IGNLU|nr:hypothetical protein ILUMI_21443 [Ignelater luminosus]